jgi:sulfur-oxidizing protein SoxY
MWDVMRVGAIVPGWLRRLALAAAVAGFFGAAAARAAEEDPWPALAEQIFAAKPMQDGEGVLALEAPYRAMDAAVVPITIRTVLPSGDSRTVRKITLVIDANPSPVAAVFTLGERAGVDLIATRVRVDDYTNVHAVAELSDGKLYMVSRYVKAAGGCSAPALKQVANAVPLGTMRFRLLAPSSGGDPAAAVAGGAKPGEREAQLMVRHPNFSGMQMDQVSRLYIPADFLHSLQIWQGQELLMSVEGGNSISENPEFRFRFTPLLGGGDEPFRAEAVDSTGERFQGEWKSGTAS